LVLGHLAISAFGASANSGSVSTGDCTDFLNGGTRNCCPTTGVCQDSSCVVFGFKNSAKSNCHTSGSNPNCPDSYCNWKVANCALTDSTHCYGTVACDNGGVTCYGYGSLCLADGSSDNFKICGDACKNDNDCPNGSGCDKTVDPAVCTSTTPTTVTSCQGCPAVTAECTALQAQYPNQLTADVPNCNLNNLLSATAAYGCAQENKNCNTLVCMKNIPASVLTTLQAVQC